MGKYILIYMRVNKLLIILIIMLLLYYVIILLYYVTNKIIKLSEKLWFTHKHANTHLLHICCKAQIRWMDTPSRSSYLQKILHARSHSPKRQQMQCAFGQSFPIWQPFGKHHNHLSNMTVVWLKPLNICHWIRQTFSLSIECHIAKNILQIIINCDCTHIFN